ncbi:hypothetical protein WOSG25_170020 [Weissella oryzae SG25]|uniref:Uncharacterized protein n=1 Tax=Weissella oryzae (strain DSM 25784 / JCM 18191 / LMG 30913 / SG25) TaxID=1329250 RepID=A0A069CWK5_WEIOS|nr:hypothetical protein [Weissella oryzae]GAK31819.1 hypothetical protein WOSG25_170020 [Weissella oryzae SG25]
MYQVVFTDKSGVERYTTYESKVMADDGLATYSNMGMANVYLVEI